MRASLEKGVELLSKTFAYYLGIVGTARTLYLK